MSHKATNWAIAQRGLKPAVKIVLWYLCDRHNRDHGCFPEQETLAEDCELPRSTLNRHLAELEAVGLIRRVRRSDKKTRRQRSTLYLFAFDFEDPYAFDPAIPAAETGGAADPKDGADPAEKPAKPCPKMRHGAVSQKQPIPCPKNGKSRVSKWDTNPVREPLMNRRAGGQEGELSEIGAFWVDQIRSGKVAGASGIKPAVAAEIRASGLLDAGQLKSAGIER